MKRTEVLKHCINVLAVVLMGAIAFLFTAYGLLYKNVGFIVDNFSILMSLTVGCGGVILYQRKAVAVPADRVHNGIYGHMRRCIFCALRNGISRQNQQCRGVKAVYSAVGQACRIHFHCFQLFAGRSFARARFYSGCGGHCNVRAV